MSGSLWSGSGPDASTTVRAWNFLRPLVFTVQTPAFSSNASPLTSTPNWIRRRRSNLSAMSSMWRADLVGRGVGPGPRRVLDERERIQQRRNIAGRTGIRVVPPGAADAVAALQDDEIVDAGLGELDRRADAGESGADDEGVVDVGAHRQAAGSWVTSLTQVGTDGSSGRGYRSESQTMELASRW